MCKQVVLSLVIASLFAACAAEDSDVELVEVGQDGRADQYSSIPPAGIYTYDQYLGGAAENGDVMALSLTASKTFRAVVSDEWQSNTTHTGTYQLYSNTWSTSFYIDLIEAARTQRFEYYMDPVEPANMWLRAMKPVASQRWYGLRFGASDCTSVGCSAGETCTECWGENVCMPDGTSC